MAREVDLGLMRLLFRFHYAMVVYVAVMNWTNCYALPRARAVKLLRIHRRDGWMCM